MELALGIGIPLAVVALFYLVKANAAIMFFITCAVVLLYDRGTKNIESILGMAVPNTPQAVDFLLPVLLVLPLIIGLLLQARYGKKWVALQLIPSIITGLLIYILSARVLAYLYDYNIRSGPIWKQLSKHEDLITAIGLFLSLIVLPLAGKGGGHDKHGKHH